MCGGTGVLLPYNATYLQGLNDAQPPAAGSPIREDRQGHTQAAQAAHERHELIDVLEVLGSEGEVLELDGVDHGRPRLQSCCMRTSIAWVQDLSQTVVLKSCVTECNALPRTTTDLENDVHEVLALEWPDLRYLGFLILRRLCGFGVFPCEMHRPGARSP